MIYLSIVGSFDKSRVNFAEIGIDWILKLNDKMNWTRNTSTYSELGI